MSEGRTHRALLERDFVTPRRRSERVAIPLQDSEVPRALPVSPGSGEANRALNPCSEAFLEHSSSRAPDFVTTFAGTSRRLIHAVARRNWLSGPTHSSGRTGLVQAPVRGHSCPASPRPFSTGLREVARDRVASFNDRSPHPLGPSHLRGHGRAHPHPLERSGVLADAARQGAPPSSFVAPAQRDRQVLPVAPASCTDSSGPSRVEVRSGVAGDRPTGARRNTGAATAARSVVAGLGCRGGVHSFARRCVDVCDRQWLLRRVSVSDRHVGVGRWAWSSIAGFSSRADVSGVVGVAAGRRILARVGNRWRVRVAVSL